MRPRRVYIKNKHTHIQTIVLGSRPCTYACCGAAAAYPVSQHTLYLPKLILKPKARYDQVVGGAPPPPTRVADSCWFGVIKTPLSRPAVMLARNIHWTWTGPGTRRGTVGGLRVDEKDAPAEAHCSVRLRHRTWTTCLLLLVTKNKLAWLT